MIVRNVEIGEGMPKICVPIVGKTREEIMAVARDICNTEADIVEWRADWFDKIFEMDEAIAVANELRQILGDIPILFTFRTKAEGGEKEIEEETYVNLNTRMIETGSIDLVDVEIFSMAEVANKLIEIAGECGVKVVGSNHDFDKTPNKDEIIRRLCHMQEVGADIPKIAVMPQSEGDVRILLEATREMNLQFADRPIITMSMGELGIVSRLEGEKYGSAVTFGCMGKASAPGQINVSELKKMLESKHR